MSDFCTQQIDFEMVIWKTSLYHLMDQNVHFKIRLSEILKTRSDKVFIEKAEDFQGEFIQFDEKLIFLRKQLSHLDVIKKICGSESEIHAIFNSLEFLRNNIMHAEIQLSELRMKFISYIKQLGN